MENKIKLEDYQELRKRKITKKVLLDFNMLHLLEEFGNIKNIEIQMNKQKNLFENTSFFENEIEFKKFCKYYEIKPTFTRFHIGVIKEYNEYSKKWGGYNPSYFIEINKIFTYKYFQFSIILDVEFIGDDKRKLKGEILKLSKYYIKDRNIIKYKNKIIMRFEE